VVTSPAAAAVAGPILHSLVPVVSKGVNDLLGTDDEFLGEYPRFLSMKEMVLMAARQNEMIHNNAINYKFETHLLTGDGSSFKGYFSLARA
jgi:hypothetical protein